MRVRQAGAGVQLAPTGPLSDLEVTDRLREVLDPKLLADAGWDWARQVLVPPVDHPTFGYRRCEVADCGRPGFRVEGREASLCAGCRKIWHRAGDTDLEAFVLAPTPRRQRRGEPPPCSVPGCAWTRWGSPFCWKHQMQRRKRSHRAGRPLTDEEFVTLPGVKALENIGRCRVAACERLAGHPTRVLCRAHDHRWRTAGRVSGLTLDDWAARESAVNVFEILNLRGLAPLAQLEMLLLIQRYVERRNHFPAYRLQGLADRLRRHAVPSICSFRAADVQDWPGELPAAVRLARLELRRALTTIADERAGDLWDLALWGHPGYIDFRPITQRWLRETVKSWAAHDLPKRRTQRTIPNTAAYAVAARRLSASLRAERPQDHGEDPAVLGRRDIEAFLAHLAELEAAGQLSGYTRHYVLRKMRMLLTEARALGLHQRGGPMAGLPERFALRRDDLTPPPASYEPGRALPSMILEQLRAGAPLLAAKGQDWAVARDLLERTGRRPEEIAGLPWDCLHEVTEHTDDGGVRTRWVLLYDEFKTGRTGLRLPIDADTARLISEQKAAARARFKDTPPEQLRLLPRSTRNPRGTLRMSVDTFGVHHREWVDGLGLVGPDGEPYNTRPVVPYAYRHSYAQRHADAGVSPDVLRDLMGHRTMQTTQGYYRVTERRTAKAVERLAQHRFNGRGERLRLEQMAADDHQRLGVGSVAVPFGNCSEPSNVKAHGHGCPYRFRCAGCAHFSTDPSYLLELRSHLERLLVDRERLLEERADLEDWARREATPSLEEIERIRRLVRKVAEAVDALDDDERVLVEEAVAASRAVRGRLLTIGPVPVRQPSPDFEPGAERR